MWKYATVLGLVGCTVNLKGADLADEGLQASFGRVVNESGAKIVLVDEPSWSFGTDAWWDVQCDSGDVDLLSIDLQDGQLNVATDDLDLTRACTIRLRQRELEQMEQDGDGDIGHEGVVTKLGRLEVNGNGAVDLGSVEVDRLEIYARGDGRVSIDDLQADELYLELAGRGDVVLGGAVAEGEVYVKGMGDLDAADLVFQDLYVELSGAGNATVTVEGTIDGTVSGEGDLDVYGDPVGTVDAIGSGLVILHDSGTGTDG